MWRHNLFSNFFPFLTSAAGDPAAKKHNDAGDVIIVIENYRNRNIGIAVMTKCVNKWQKKVLAERKATSHSLMAIIMGRW